MTTATLAQEALWRMSRDLALLPNRSDIPKDVRATVIRLMQDLNIASGYVWQQVQDKGSIRPPWKVT